MGGTAFNQLYPEALDMHLSSPTRCRNLKEAVNNQPIPGDTVYFKNHNYGEIMNDMGRRVQEYLRKKGLMPENIFYLSSGENALYIGGGHYEGLGGVDVQDKSAGEMRLTLMNDYNNNFERLWEAARKNGGILTVTIDGVQMTYDIQKMTPATAASLITIENIMRVTN